jgi:DNA polymerase V
MSSKTFGREITSRSEMEEAIANYVARAAEKLREQDSLTSCLTIFIKTNSFKTNVAQYSNSYTVNFPYPTAFTPDLLRYALAGLKAIYQDGYSYYKAGVYFTRITPQSFLQPDLFGDFSLAEHYRQAHFMAIVDAINNIYGHDTLLFAIQGLTRRWKMRQLKLSNRFTTRWSEILTI